MKELPENTQQHILSYLFATDINSIASVCTDFLKLALAIRFTKGAYVEFIFNPIIFIDAPF